MASRFDTLIVCQYWLSHFLSSFDTVSPEFYLIQTGEIVIVCVVSIVHIRFKLYYDTTGRTYI